MATPAPTTAEGARRRATLLVGLAVTLAVVGVAVVHRDAIASGGRALRTADLRWLGLAAAASAAVWVVGAAAQAGSVDVRLPKGQLLAVQVAGSFVNQVVPAGLGGLTVNLRFFRKQGLGPTAAVGAVALGATVTVVTHLLLLVVLALAAPALLARLADAAHLPDPGPQALLLLVPAVGVVLLLRGRVRWPDRLREDAARLARVARTPARAAQLWLGSAGGPLLHGLVLLAVLRSLSVDVSLTPVVVYLAASALSALVPSPGAVGALDVLLVAGLTGGGLPATTAVAGVVGYRLVTVWVPLLPSALVLVALVRRRVI